MAPPSLNTIAYNSLLSLRRSLPSFRSTPPPVLLEEGVQFAFDVDKGVVSHVVRLARLPPLLPLVGGHLGWRRRRRRRRRRGCKRRGGGGGGGLGCWCQDLPYLFMGLLLDETKKIQGNNGWTDVQQGAKSQQPYKEKSKVSLLNSCEIPIHVAGPAIKCNA